MLSVIVYKLYFFRKTKFTIKCLTDNIKTSNVIIFYFQVIISPVIWCSHNLFFSIHSATKSVFYTNYI